MGNQNQNTEREGLKRSKKYKETNKMLQFLTCATILSLSVGAPQYGGVQPSPPVKKAPLTGSVQCRTEYTTLWDTEYKETETEVCTTEYEKVCRTETQRLCQPTTRQECNTVSVSQSCTQRLCQPTTRQECNTVCEKQCNTVYKNVCVEQYKTEYEPYTETECVTEYKEDCEYQWEGHGHDKVWAPIAGTCKTNPYETCKDVAKTKERQVAYPVCQDVPRQACQAIHKKVPVRISRQVPKKVCQDGHPVIHNAVPANNLVPSPVSSLPEILDARRENENKQNTLLFERSQVVDSPSDNAIVFGD